MYFLQQGLGMILYEKIPKSPKKQCTPEMKMEIEEFIKLRETGAEILSTESEGREEFLLAKNMSDNSSDIVSRILLHK